MFNRFLINFIILSFVFEFVEFIFPNKGIGEFVRFGVVLIFLYYIVQLIYNIF